MRPAILLLDEVTSALDPTLVGEVLDLLTELAHQGMTMLIATHEMSFARDVAHEVAYLDQGVLVEKGTPAEIFTSPREESTKNFLSRVH
jgi:polar amino acid transport system ATP-binding protein